MNYDSTDDIIIKQNFSPRLKRVLEKSGVSHSCFMRANASINLSDSIVKIESELNRTKVRKITVVKQLKMFEKVWENPLWGSYLYVISSYPSDLRAKNVALTIMAKAMDQYYQKKRTNKILIKRTPPIWHHVMSGFKDKFLDVESGPVPSLLVISNVTEDSTQLKLEKLRDLIVKYDGIPRIIVTTSMDPVSFIMGSRSACPTP